MKKKLWILGEYFAHLIMGAAMFVGLLIFGGGLNKLVQVASPWIGDESFIESMKFVEKIILYADIVFIVWWTVYSTFKAIKEMLK